METLTIKLKSENARKLITDLEALDILEILENKNGNTGILELKHKLSTPMSESDIDTQLKKIRDEWQPNI